MQAVLRRHTHSIAVRWFKSASWIRRYSGGTTFLLFAYDVIVCSSAALIKSVFFVVVFVLVCICMYLSPPRKAKPIGKQKIWAEFWFWHTGGRVWIKLHIIVSSARCWKCVCVNQKLWKWKYEMLLYMHAMRYTHCDNVCKCIYFVRARAFVCVCVSSRKWTLFPYGFLFFLFVRDVFTYFLYM